MSADSLGAQGRLNVEGREYTIFDIAKAEAIEGADVARLPISLKILLENMLRHEDGETVTQDDIARIATWPGSSERDGEIPFHPVRVLMPDSSGIPLLADLAAMREATARQGGDPTAVNPRIPVDLIVDHSVTAEFAGTPGAFAMNIDLEYERNRERYSFLKWASKAYRNLRVAPPGAGIVHQVNVEYLSRPIWSAEKGNELHAFPDTLLGMDSHTPMINSLGVLGWGVGGIEAGSAVLGQPISLAIPEVVACRLSGALREGVTSTDLVLTVTQRLRKKGVIGKLVEFTGPGMASLSLPDRATLANMAPEYGATMGFFPIDAETVRYLRATGRPPEAVALAEAYARHQGMWGGGDADTVYSDEIRIDLSEVEPSMAGPKRPQDRRSLSQVPASMAENFPAAGEGLDPIALHDPARALRHGDVVLASITSCTNTSNPSLLIGAGLLARNAERLGLRPKPWVKTSLSPGSRVVADYLESAGLQGHLDALGFHIVGFGCMTCAGGSGSLARDISAQIDERQLAVAAVLSSNRNFEGRIHPQAQAAYIGSPPLVVAYALAGSVMIDLENDPLGHGKDGQPVYLRDIWPGDAEIRQCVEAHLGPELFRRRYATIHDGDERWHALESQDGPVFDWDPDSTYLRRPPFFDTAQAHGDEMADIVGARALAMFGDSITTDHISPASSIDPNGLAGRYLQEQGVPPARFSSFVARRVNHDVMLRGQFDNPRNQNEMLPARKGGFTRHWPDGAEMHVYEAARRYADEDVPLVVIAGKEYGTGSSRDWAAKGTALLGIRAVIAESFERIHRSNLAGMGVIPLQFLPGEDRRTLELDGTEQFDVIGMSPRVEPRARLTLRIRRGTGEVTETTVICRLDTRREVDWHLSGGVLHYVLEEIAGKRRHS